MHDAQDRVRAFCERHDLVLEPEGRVLDLVSEIGEVTKEILKSTDYGTTPRRTDPALEEELGDVCFSLLALASELEIDLRDALERALSKYRRRLESSGDGPGSGA